MMSGKYNVIVVYPQHTTNIVVDNLAAFKKAGLKMSFSKFINKLFDKVNISTDNLTKENLPFSFYLTPRRKSLFEKRVMMNEPLTVYFKQITDLVVKTKIKTFSDEDMIKKFLKWVFTHYPNYRRYQRHNTKYKKPQYKKYGIETKIVSVYLNKKTRQLVTYFSEKYQISISELINIMLAKAFNLKIFDKLVKTRKDVDWKGLINELFGVDINSIMETPMNQITDALAFRHHDRPIKDYLRAYAKRNNKQEFVNYLADAIWFATNKSISRSEIVQKLWNVVKKHWQDIRNDLVFKE